MSNELPPSGRWTGYYLYGHGGSRHHMKLTLAFAGNGAIDGEGVDDIRPFVITGRFDVATSAAHWTKAYVGMHTVEYAGCIAGARSAATGSCGASAGAFGSGRSLSRIRSRPTRTWRSTSRW